MDRSRLVFRRYFERAGGFDPTAASLFAQPSFLCGFGGSRRFAGPRRLERGADQPAEPLDGLFPIGRLTSVLLGDKPQNSPLVDPRGQPFLQKILFLTAQAWRTFDIEAQSDPGAGLVYVLTSRPAASGKRKRQLRLRNRKFAIGVLSHRFILARILHAGPSPQQDLCAKSGLASGSIRGWIPGSRRLGSVQASAPANCKAAALSEFG